MDNEVKEKFKGRPVLVTGADGFIGSHLTEKLVEYEADVHAFIRASSTKEQSNMGHILGKIKMYMGDLTDPLSVRLALKNLKGLNDVIIFHLGAQAHVGESWERPYETFMTNTIGTLNLLQSIIDLDLDVYKFDFAGTSEEFGNMEDEQKDLYKFRDDGVIIFNEKSPVNPQSPYATSKVAADFLCRNYYLGYGLPVIVTRMFNNYGPRQNPRYVTGTIITQALMRTQVVLGNLETTRDFTYVLDGVRGHLYATLKGTPGHLYAYGYGEDISIGDWANLILRIGEEEGYWRNRVVASKESRYRPGKSDIIRLGVDYSKIKKYTGWKPIYAREEGIKKTIKWYSENKEKWLGRIDW